MELNLQLMKFICFSFSFLNVLSQEISLKFTSSLDGNLGNLSASTNTDIITSSIKDEALGVSNVTEKTTTVSLLHLSSIESSSIQGTTPLNQNNSSSTSLITVTTTSDLASPSTENPSVTVISTSSQAPIETPPSTTTESTTTSLNVTNIIPSKATTLRPALKEKANCDEQLIYVDSCIKRIVLIGDHEAVIPKTVQELEENHCNRIHGELVCVRDYGKSCLKLFPRTIFTLVRKNVERVYKNFCHTQEGKEAAIKHFSCFKPQNLPVLHSVIDRITMTLEYIQFNVTNDNDILPYMCCAFYTFYRQTRVIVDNMCMNTTGPETSTFIINIIKAIVTDALDLGCGRFGSYKKCQENLPQGVQVFNDIFSLNHTGHAIDNNQHHSHDDKQKGPIDVVVSSQAKYSPVIPMIAISKRLDSGFRRRR